MSLHKLVIIIPALNEAKTIASVIQAIPTTITGIGTREVVVVNDGSTDQTAARASAAGADVIYHSVPRGVGAAFHTGLRDALRRGADIVVNIDADGQFEASDIPALIQPILDQKFDFVTATRFAKKHAEPDMPPIKRWGNLWMTRLINFITKQNFTDVSCGFRAYSREAALRLTLFGHFTYTQETFIDLAFKNLRMTEVPLIVRGEREHGRSRVASNLWRYGLKSATIIFRAARDYNPHYFFGIPGLLIALLGTAAGIFLLVHYLQTGQTYPYRSLVSISGVLVIVGFLLLFLSMIGDMLHRNRILIEETLYHARSSTYKRNDK